MSTRDVTLKEVIFHANYSYAVIIFLPHDIVAFKSINGFKINSRKLMKGKFS